MSAPASPAPVRRRRGLRVRTAILAAMIALTGLALVTAGWAAAQLQALRVDDRIDEDLTASAEEFRVLASVGVDPATGEPFTSPEDLVRTAMERVIPARNEGVIGIVGGQIQYTARASTVALEDDPELVDALGPLVTGDTAEFATVTTDQTTYRLVAVPVRTAADGSLAEEPDDDLPAFDSVAALVIGYDRDAELATFREVFTTYAWVAAAALGVVTLVGWAVSGRLLRPVRVLASTARRIGREDLSERVPVTGRDDMAEMTESVNEMLARLEAAFESQSRLVGDVSHELRTPLTIIRGHLELMDTDDPSDAREVRDLVLDEIQRMNRVVSDLSVLAAADRPDFVTLAPSSLGVLTDEVFDKAVPLGERRWEIEERADADIPVDRERLTQAWLQLAANAVKFSEPDSRIAIGSRLDERGAHVWVSDAGVGVAPEDRARIFERFARAEGHGKPGSGLGLTIVKAIAEAHGGSVACEGHDGGGSVFTITIPALGARGTSAPDAEPASDPDSEESP